MVHLVHMFLNNNDEKIFPLESFRLKSILNLPPYQRIYNVMLQVNDLNTPLFEKQL